MRTGLHLGAEYVARLTDEQWVQLEASYRPSKEKIIDAIAAWKGWADCGFWIARR